MGAYGCLEVLTQYNSPKHIRIESFRWGCVKGFLYLAVALAVGSFIVKSGLHQEVDEIISSIRISVKGVAYTKDRIWDTAEYTIPTQAADSFFVMTNIIETENQRKQRCPEYPFIEAICLSDNSCKNGSVDIHSNGIQTGRCVEYNVTFKTCEVEAWCPVQPMETPPEPALLRSSENFTVLIKNNINIPKFNYNKLNMPPDFNNSCRYNNTTSPLCPIFRLGDIVQEANQKFSEMAVKGGVIAIRINWDCNLDSWYDCSPKYSFRRLDDKKTVPGFYISYSSWGKSTFCKIYNRKKHETVLNPTQVMYVSYVDEPHIILIKTLLKTSLQHAEGRIVESHPVKFCDAGSCCTIESNENQDNKGSDPMHTTESEENDDKEEHELGQPLRQETSSSDYQKWCCCDKCQPTQKYHEQLCCRRKKGPCITTSHWFQQLVLSRHTLKKALLYKDPFLDLTDGNINNQLCHLAYKQYVHWRFGFFDLEDRAIVPSCCRWKIRHTYPKEGNIYTGFKIE